MASATTPELSALAQLARLYGVQASYVAMDGAVQQASPETLLALVQAMDLSLRTLADAPEALRQAQRRPWLRRVEPVAVAWEGRTRPLEVSLPPESNLEARLCWELRCEDGEVFRGDFIPAKAELARTAPPDGQHYPVFHLPLPERLPLGYHKLRVEGPDFAAQTLVLAAPRRAWQPAGRRGRREWGVFLPLYALRGTREAGAGNYSDFGELVEWVNSLGGSVAATLPLMAAFLEEPFGPSPYAPASRLFWNELYIDLARVPELEGCAPARELMGSAAYRAEEEALRGAELVDYARQWQMKRAVLSELARAFFASDSPRRAELEQYARQRPRLRDYAAFRAAGRARHGSWWVWPEHMQGGRLSPEDYAAEDFQFFLYAQWLAQQQIDELADRARQAGPGLYLDLPLGVHPDSYDVWHEPENFALDLSGGAPPDAFFSKGQNWGFPPLHPLRIRENGYRYVIDSMRQLMRHAGVVRIDHVMGLHRLYWVPKGMEATEGTYVHYHADEMYAILNLESHRHQSLVVGEDLGTVPDYVRRALRSHNVRRMYVGQFSVQPNPEAPLEAVGRGMVASLNTHDTPTFAGFWHERDLDDQVQMGLLDKGQEREARQRRAAIRQALVHYFAGEKAPGRVAASTGNGAGRLEGIDDEQFEAVLRGALACLAQSPAGLVLVNLEDLWGELKPQNVPGTSEAERPNWVRRARRSLAEIKTDARIGALLGELHRLRQLKFQTMPPTPPLKEVQS